MILGYEDPVQMPTMDIYSTDLMKAYIGAVKDQYDTAVQDYKDYMKLYQDFYSPIAKDNERWQELTTGGMLNLINGLQSQGIDPHRSREGRAAIQNFINSAPIAELSRLRASAENAKEFLKSKDKLMAEGRWNPMVDAAIGGGSLDNWDTSSNGVWGRTSAIENKSLEELTNKFYSNLQKDMYLGPDTSRGKYAKYFDLMGSSENELSIADAAALSELMNTPYYNLYRQMYGGQVDSEGNPIDDNVSLMRAIRLANEKHWAQPKSVKNDIAWDLYKEARADARAERAAQTKQQNSKNGTEYSIYRSISNSSNDNIINNFSASGGLIHETKDGVMFLQPDKNGKHVINNETYKEVSYKKLQGRLILDNKSTNQTWYKPLSTRVTGVPYEIATGNKIDEDGGIKLTKSMLGNIHTIHSLSLNVAGMDTPLDKNKSYYDDEWLKNALNDAFDKEEDIYIAPTYEAFDYMTKNENINTMLVCTIKVPLDKDKSKKITCGIQIGERNKYYQPTPKWAPYMMEFDRLEGTKVVGKTDSVDINNQQRYDNEE